MNSYAVVVVVRLVDVHVSVTFVLTIIIGKVKIIYKFLVLKTDMSSICLLKSVLLSFVS